MPAASLKFPNLKQSILISLVIALFITLFFVMRGMINEIPYTVTEVAMSMLYSFLVSASLFILDGIIIRWLFLQFPWDKRPFLRVVLELFFGVLNACAAALVILLILRAIFYATYNETNVTGNVAIDQIGIAIVFNLLMIMLFEGIFFFRQWRESLVEAEISKRRQLESQYNALKNQVNPHFLFNSLNILSALIDDSPDRAKEFVERFSNMYRYMLEQHETGLSTVSEELRFLDDYFYLQKMRYQENLRLELNVSSETLQQYVPDMAIQMLVENAIKHNEISELHPLDIEITDRKNLIEVKNKVRERNKPDRKTGKGLKNLSARYAMLTGRRTSFRLENGYFIATIPLLNAEEE